MEDVGGKEVDKGGGWREERGREVGKEKCD